MSGCVYAVLTNPLMVYHCTGWDYLHAFVLIWLCLEHGTVVKPLVYDHPHKQVLVKIQIPLKNKTKKPQIVRDFRVIVHHGFHSIFWCYFLFVSSQLCLMVFVLQWWFHTNRM